ncbi:hypothetical protein GCM10011578_074490 [Streptomyces fuscichromogenes]|uniref:Uncharacterized protein n=1 Tax=Streptomyces fuscichromogenes TaxID=1324013 RepID=A0A917XL55_9ACTN|nr:hypothetical protein GCM10011578_074490 [Streptomyces fuscichromogenes]
MAVAFTALTTSDTAETPEDGTPPTPATWKDVVEAAPSVALTPRDERVSTIFEEGETGKNPPLETVLAPACARLPRPSHASAEKSTTASAKGLCRVRLA